MKRLFLSALVWLAIAGVIFSGEFKSAIITTTTLTINVPDGRVLYIKNFTQEGGDQRGVVTVTKDGSTTNVLNAAIIDKTVAGPEIISSIVIAGPAVATVPPVSGATLFITYRKGPQPDLSGTPSPSSSPGPTPTPTATATATPAPLP